MKSATITFNYNSDSNPRYVLFSKENATWFVTWEMGDRHGEEVPTTFHDSDVMNKLTYYLNKYDIESIKLGK